MPLWCLYFDSHLNTHRSNIGVQWRKATNQITLVHLTFSMCNSNHNFKERHILSSLLHYVTKCLFMVVIEFCSSNDVSLSMMSQLVKLLLLPPITPSKGRVLVPFSPDICMCSFLLDHRTKITCNYIRLTYSMDCHVTCWNVMMFKVIQFHIKIWPDNKEWMVDMLDNPRRNCAGELDNSNWRYEP